MLTLTEALPTPVWANTNRRALMMSDRALVTFGSEVKCDHLLKTLGTEKRSPAQNSGDKKSDRTCSQTYPCLH